MTTKELREAINELPFTTSGKVSGGETTYTHVLKYESRITYWYNLYVNFRERTCSLSSFIPTGYSGRVIQTEFTDLHVHKLNKEQFINTINYFIQ